MRVVFTEFPLPKKENIHKNQKKKKKEDRALFELANLGKQYYNLGRINRLNHN